MPVATKALAELSDLFGEYDELIDEVEAREGAANWLADEVDDESASLAPQYFDCEINGGPFIYVAQDGEYLDFDIDTHAEYENEAPVSLGVHQVMHLRDLLNAFLALPVNAAAVKELEGAL